MVGLLNLIAVAGTAILSVRLFLSGLYRRYWAFFLYLIFATLREGFVSGINPSKSLYMHFWVLTEPLEWLFFVLVVLELYGLVLQDYRGLSTVGRWALVTAVVVALAASSLTLLAPSHSTIQGPLLAFYYQAERAVYFSLVVFLLTILGVLMQYPISLNRNIIVHSVVFSIYFLGFTMVYVLLSTHGYVASLMEATQDAAGVINIAALATWLLMLTPAGELRKVRLRPAWMPGREEDLVGHLNHLNAALLRATRK